MYKGFLKRMFDFIFSIVGLIILSPISILIALILVIVTRENPFFLQIRPGKNEKLFYLVKFRTMSEKCDIYGELLPDYLRLTKIGLLIRKTSLDEIPQLLNVIKGDMSFIGPRPLLTEYLPLYNETQKKRHNVRPGITGWAQVNGRNALNWQDKFEYDIWYVENLSFNLDCKILRKTISTVFRSEGISSGSSVTMEKFVGN